MRGYMFRNRWFALLFVASVLAGVTKLVGTEKDGGAIDDARAQFEAQRAQAEAFTSAAEPTTTVGTGSAPVELVPDEELIDAAQGYDPTPVDEFAAAQQQDGEVVTGGEVAIVSQDAGQTGQLPQ